MKIILLTLLAAGLAFTLSTAFERPFAADGFFAGCFVIGLGGWTLAQYTYPPRWIRCARPIRLPLPGGGDKHSPSGPDKRRDRLAA
jgi:hypothetical protein